MSTTYLQVFSMTDHAQAFDRFKGPYSGLNATLVTSEVEGGLLKISNATQTKEGDISREALEGVDLILAYRHTDTGALSGTSELLLPISSLPWNDIPGFEILSKSKKEGIRLKLWTHELDLPVDRVYRVHFGKTIVYFRNFGEVDALAWDDASLKNGPGELHAEMIDQDLTFAPPSGSGLQVKQGQETTND